MMNWRNADLGQKVVYSVTDFDGKGSFPGSVTEKYSDHLIIRIENEFMEMNLWVDDFNVDMFVSA